ncbi:MAG: segregation and condensation protein A [Thermoanaerobaculia bacterium]
MSLPATGGGLLPEAWQVHLPVFEGPLDLLLQLCKLNRVEVTEIPVATVCDQFHEYLGLMEELNLDVAGDYIYVAALLIHLKSRSLLPRPSTPEGEPEEDPREELVQRLLEYRRIKEAAQAMAEIDGLRRGIWTRHVRPTLPAAGDEEESLDLGEVSLYDLLGALRDALRRYEREHPPALHLDRESFSVRAQFERLLEALDPGTPLDLVADLGRRSCRAEAVAAFLAVLELARLQLVRLHQTTTRDILLYRTTREVAVHELEALDT